MKGLCYIILVAAVIFLAACARHSGSGAAMDPMDREDAVMEDRPDSALTLLQGIASSTLSGRRR